MRGQFRIFSQDGLRTGLCAGLLILTFASTRARADFNPFSVMPAPVHLDLDRSGLNYLKPGAFSITQTLLAPPALQDQAEQVDLDQVLQAQAHRTAQDCARALLEVDQSLQTFFGAPYGPLSDREVKAYKPFIDKARRDGGYFAGLAKDQYRRPRPFIVDPKDIQLCPGVDKPDTYSYPSGHSTDAHLIANILSRLDPNRSPLFFARADQIAQDRVITGVHFPTDIQAGVVLANRIFEALNRSPKFVTDLQQVKTANPPR